VYRGLDLGRGLPRFGTLDGRADEVTEQRLRPQWPRLELRVVLRRDEERVAGKLDRLDKAGLPVLLVPGTHDSPSYRRSIFRRLRLPKSAHLFLSPTLEAGPHLTIGGESIPLMGFAQLTLFFSAVGIVIASVMVSVMTGLISGFAPAWSASRLDPVAALRYE